MSELVSGYPEVVQNVKQFHRDLDIGTDIVSQLSQFRHWYYVPGAHTDRFQCLGPSKFIGYKKMTTLSYGRGKHKDGRKTEARLLRWFKRERDSNRIRELKADVEILLARFGKKINKKAKIHVPK